MNGSGNQGRRYVCTMFKGRHQNSRVADCHQLLQPLADGHGIFPQEHILYHLKYHILLTILIGIHNFLQF